MNHLEEKVRSIVHTSMLEDCKAGVPYNELRIARVVAAYVKTYAKEKWFSSDRNLPEEGHPVWGTDGENYGSFHYVYSGEGEWCQHNEEAEQFTPTEWYPLKCE